MRGFFRACAVAMLLMLGAPAAMAVPTVNGLFYGDGDFNEYVLYDTSAYGSNLYIYFDAPSNRLYVALVVSRNVNDNVFDQQGAGSSAYLATAGWGGNRSASNLINSEFAEFTLSCDDSPLEWQWQQGYACKVGDEWESTADSTCGGGDGSPVPTSYDSSSSFVYNLNTYENTYGGPPATGAPWNLYVWGTAVNRWKSPFDANNPNTVINASEGYPATGNITYSETYDYEWPMVYEWSVDLGAAGCGGNSVFVVTGSSHHSPSKTGDPDDPFEDPPEDPLSDLGDLPASYGTLREDGGAQHYITSTAPYLGSLLDPELNGVPTVDALGDNQAGQNDEDGVVANITSAWTAGSQRTLEVTASGPGLLGAWFDWNGDGDFDDEGEFFTIPVVGGVNTLTVTVGDDFNWENDRLYGRFRVFSGPAAAPGGSLDGGDYVGVALDGEVEDYTWEAGSLPVSLNSFESRLTGRSLRVEWSTASETFNVGFNLWAQVNDEWKLLTEDPVLSSAVDAVTPQAYETRVSLRDMDPRSIMGLALSSIETTGEQEMYGSFEVGRSYGERSLPEPIAWDVVRNELDTSMRGKGYVKTGRTWRRGGGNVNTVSSESPQAVESSAVEVMVSSPGMQRVTYEAMAAAGLDLAGVGAGSIAVTLKGEGVPRVINTGHSGGGFGPGGYVEFWGGQPDYPDALYVADYVYRIEVNDDLARSTDRVMRRQKSGETIALHPVRVNEDLAYSFSTATEDPWYAAMLRYPWGPVDYSVSVDVDDALAADRPGRVEVVLTARTSFPEVDPDHRIRLRVNGQVVLEREADGNQALTLVGEVPAGVLVPGGNTVTVDLPGGTAAPFDIVMVDRVALWYPRTLAAMDDRLHVEDEVTASGLQGSGFTNSGLVGYARSGEGRLHELRVDARRTGGSWTAVVPTVSPTPGVEGVEYWLSTASAVNRPQLLGTVQEEDLLSEPADYLLIVHPSFMPESGDASHPLNRYMDRRQSQGWRVRAVALDAVQNAYGGGMALPGAVTSFLSAADEAFDYSHVLLVGDDSYDYLDNLGLGSVSFIPTMYTKANVITHSPSDGLLTDLDGDGLSDKAVGRWPVRTLTDLEVMVRKTLDWEDSVSGTRDARTSVWVTDSEDPAVASFEAQAERMIGTLQTPLAGGGGEPWPAEQISRVYFDEVSAEPGQSVAQTARGELMEALSAGQTVTGFVGHGSPTAWTFQGLLGPQHVSEMANEGRPTLITTLTCYTSYFVSPNTDTLAHRLMKGYRKDSQGNEIPGVANGAVAVHGAATLSGYTDNESLARRTLAHQLQDGDTLGEAIRKARVAAFEAGQLDTAKNWALLGDPTLTIGQ